MNMNSVRKHELFPGAASVCTTQLNVYGLNKERLNQDGNIQIQQGRRVV